MVRRISISPEESDLTLPTRDEEREVKETDPLSSSYPTWSSRMRCLEAYVCVVMSFMMTLEHCQTIGIYGSIVFIAYLICAVIIIVPIVFLEIMLGRYVMGDVVKAWSMTPLAKGLVACLFLTTVDMLHSNNMCNIYLLKYLFSLYHGYIPWNDCRSPWAKENCFVFGKNATAFVKCALKHSEEYCLNLNWESSGMQYWSYKFADIKDLDEIWLSALYLALSLAVVVLINFRGHRRCEKAFIILVYLPLIISFLLTFAAYISPSGLMGILKVFTFKWSLIYDWKMWLTVFEDFLLSTGLGTFALTCVSSHGKFKDNIVIDVLVVSFTSVFSSLLIAVPILSVAAITKHLQGHYAFSGTFLESSCHSKLDIFIWMSEALLQFPQPDVFWAFLFYVEMILISLANQTITMLALCEGVRALFLEKKNFFYYSIAVGITSYAYALPRLFIAFSFELPNKTSMTTIVFLFMFTWQIFYGFKRLNDDYQFMVGYPPSFIFLRLFWIFSIPLLSGILALKMYFRVPEHPLSYTVFIYIAIPVALYLFVAMVQIIRAAKRGNISSAFKADPNWGPENSVLKMSRVIFDTRAITKEFMYRQELYEKPLLKPFDFSEQNIVQLT